MSKREFFKKKSVLACCAAILLIFNFILYMSKPLPLQNGIAKECCVIYADIENLSHDAKEMPKPKNRNKTKEVKASTWEETHRSKLEAIDYGMTSHLRKNLKSIKPKLNQDWTPLVTVYSDRPREVKVYDRQNKLLQTIHLTKKHNTATILGKYSSAKANFNQVGILNNKLLIKSEGETIECEPLGQCLSYTDKGSVILGQTRSLLNRSVELIPSFIFSLSFVLLIFIIICLIAYFHNLNQEMTPDEKKKRQTVRAWMQKQCYYLHVRRKKNPQK